MLALLVPIARLNEKCRLSQKLGALQLERLIPSDSIRQGIPPNVGYRVYRRAPPSSRSGQIFTKLKGPGGNSSACRPGAGAAGLRLRFQDGSVLG